MKDVTITTAVADASNFTFQKLEEILRQFRAPTNFFDSLKLANSIVPERGDLLIIDSELLKELKAIRGVVVPFWVKGSTFLPSKNEGFIIRGDWQNLLVRYTLGSFYLIQRNCTECGGTFDAYTPNVTLCQGCDFKLLSK